MLTELPPDDADIPPRGGMAKVVEELSEIFATNALSNPGRFATNAAIAGKSAEPVCPATYTFPSESIAIPFAESSLLPPRYVAHKNAVPDEFSLAAKASLTTSVPPENVA